MGEGAHEAGGGDLEQLEVRHLLGDLDRVLADLRGGEDVDALQRLDHLLDVAVVRHRDKPAPEMETPRVSEEAVRQEVQAAVREDA